MDIDIFFEVGCMMIQNQVAVPWKQTLTATLPAIHNTRPQSGVSMESLLRKDTFFRGALPTEKTSDLPQTGLFEQLVQLGAAKSPTRNKIAFRISVEAATWYQPLQWTYGQLLNRSLRT